MDHTGNLLRRLLSLAVLLALIAIMVIAFKGTDKLAAILSPTSARAPVATLSPNRDVSIDSIHEVILAGADVPIDGLYHPALDLDTLVALATTGNGAPAYPGSPNSGDPQKKTAIVAIDLKTGAVERLTPFANEGHYGNPYISGNYVAWIEPTGDIRISKLHVIDRTTHQDSVVKSAQLSQLDFKGDILVWQEYRGLGWGIYGYNLKTSQDFKVADGPQQMNAYPHPCSDEWVIYLANVQEASSRSWVGSADLHAYDLTTGADALIGQVPVPRSSDPPHTCDGTSVTWTQLADAPSGYEYHFYDLSTKTDRKLNNMPGQVGLIPTLLLSDNVLIAIGLGGFDMDRNMAFDLPGGLSPEQRFGAPWLLSKNRLAWIIDVRHLYTGLVTR
jgi:hypothetical protein